MYENSDFSFSRYLAETEGGENFREGPDNTETKGELAASIEELLGDPIPYEKRKAMNADREGEKCAMPAYVHSLTSADPSTKETAFFEETGIPDDADSHPEADTLPEENVPPQESTSLEKNTLPQENASLDHASATDDHFSEDPGKSSAGLTKGRVVFLALVFSLLGGALGAVGVLHLIPYLSEKYGLFQETAYLMESTRKGSTVLETIPAGSGQRMTPAEIYSANVNSTVGITTSISTSYLGTQATMASNGSGFILTSNGYLITNHHVIENASSVTATLYDGRVYEAEVVGYDQINDIAVLKIEAEGLTPVVIGDSDTVMVGDPVVAIGNPFGELTFSLTYGVVSALEREITIKGATLDLIQTDAAINSGNSGGALYNIYGEMIAITNAKYSSSSYSTEASIDNIGFAIPFNRVRRIITSIIEEGVIIRPYIGVSVQNLTLTGLNQLGLENGIRVAGIMEEGPAMGTGLMEDDIILKIDDIPAVTTSQMINYISHLDPGRVVTLTVLRGQENLEISITIGERRLSAFGE